MTFLRPLRPEPRAYARAWGGTRFSEDGAPVGEVWIAGPRSEVSDPVDPGVRIVLDDLAARDRERLVGSAGMALLGARFPLLVKILDPASWLSIQLHPDDAQARELDAGSVGKHEAWYVIEGEGEGAPVMIGPLRDGDREVLHDAIAAGDLPASLLETFYAPKGTIIDVPPGTLHSVGPGALLYELQQPSDLTLRVSDWGRQSTDRPLHTAEALRCVDLGRRAEVITPDGESRPRLLTTDRFRLEIVESEAELRPGGRTVEIVTAVDGSAVVEGDGWHEELRTWETLVVPAAVESYVLRPRPHARICVASLP